MESLVVYEDVDYVSELSIDFYGEAQFSEELFDRVKRYLEDVELNQEMDNTLREQLEPLGIKRLLLEGDFFRKSVAKVLDEMSI